MKKYQKDSTPPQISLGFSSNKLGFVQHQRLRNGAGFTLIELLVVITVLGVLATIVLLAVNPGEQLARAKDASRIEAVTQLSRALQAYYTANGVYPDEDPASITESLAVSCWWFWNAGTTRLSSSHKFLQSLIDSGDLKSVPIEQHPFGTSSSQTCSYRYGKVVNPCAGCSGGYAVIYSSLESDRPGGQDQRPLCIQACGWSEGSPSDKGYAVYLPY